MSARYKVFRVWIKNEGFVYTSATSSKQAAAQLGHKLNCFIESNKIREVTCYVYKFQTRSTSRSQTKEVEVLAKSTKQALFYFYQVHGRPWFVRIDNIRIAKVNDYVTRKEGEFLDVTP